MWKKLKVWAVCLGVAALTGAIAGEASAKTAFPAIGGGGDANSMEVCPAGQYLIGLRGRVGAWIDDISIVCAAVGADNVVASTQFYGIERGGPTGVFQQMDCGQGAVVVAWSITLTDENRQVRDIGVRCKALATGAIRNFSFFSAATQAGNYKNVSDTKPTQECPNGELAKGYQINYGRAVNALGLLCYPLEPAPPPATAPAAAPKPIHGTGAASSTTTASTSGTPKFSKAFAGQWALTTSDDVAYTLTLTQNGQEVNGVFYRTGGNSRYNGTLTGSVVGTVLTYTFQQPTANISGSGKFMLMSNDRLLVGNAVSTDGKVKFDWKGSRK